MICPIDSLLCLTEALQFHEVPFINSRSYSTSHCCSIQEFSSCTHIFKAFPYFLLYKFQCLWFYVEFLNPLRFDLSTGDRNGSIHILLHDNRQLCQHHLLKMLSFFPLDAFSSLVKGQVTIGVWDQVTADAGKDMEKEEHSSIVGGILSLYNHSGNQSCSSSENWI